MALFVAKHQHGPEACPAGDPQMGPMLLQHLSEANAAKYGISIHGEAVIDGQHTLYMILDASDSEKVNEFLAPFAQAGTVEVLAANPMRSRRGQGQLLTAPPTRCAERNPPPAFGAATC